MKNQDMPVNAHPSIHSDNGVTPSSTGETKYEKAFWMMFSSLASAFPSSEIDEIVKGAIEATDAGFKALEDKV